MGWLDDIENEDNGKRNHPTMKNVNKLTPKNHETISPYDWALDTDLNPNWALWDKEMSKYFGYTEGEQ